MLLLSLLFTALANPLKQLPGSCDGYFALKHATLVSADTFQGEPALFFDVEVPPQERKQVTPEGPLHQAWGVITNHAFYPRFFIYELRSSKEWSELEWHAGKGYSSKPGHYQALGSEETYLFLPDQPKGRSGFLVRSCFVPSWASHRAIPRGGFFSGLVPARF